MTPGEQAELHQIKNEVSELKRAVIGTERHDFNDGIEFQFRRMQEEFREMKATYAGLRKIVIGIAIGVGIGSLIFGFITLKEFVGFVK